MIVLDTHIFLWMNLSQERVPVHILNAIKTEAQLGISAISLWETAMLVQYGRVEIPDESLITWFRIAATAMEHGCRLATVDERLVNFKQLQTVAP